MMKKTQCGIGCSLRSRTLILLWIVMIGCGFHMCSVKFDQNQSIIHHNQESGTVNPKNNALEVDGFNKAIRSKRSLDVFSKIGATVNEAVQIPGKVINKAGETVEHAASSASSTFHNVTSGIKNKVNAAIIQGSTFVYNTFALEITEEIIKQITAHVIDQVNKSNVLDKTINSLIENLVDNIFDRVDERFDNFIKSIVRFIIRIYSIIGVGSSVLGIYGIHTNNSNCLAFSVFFFQFTIISEILFISEINVDLNMERKMFLLSELVRIDWKGWHIVEDPMMLVNVGILLIIAISFYFSALVKKCQSTMLEKCIKKEINVEENLYS